MIPNIIITAGIFSLGMQERVRKSRGKQAISVLAIEVLLYKLSMLILSSAIEYISVNLCAQQ